MSRPLRCVHPWHSTRLFGGGTGGEFREGYVHNPSWLAGYTAITFIGRIRAPDEVLPAGTHYRRIPMESASAGAANSELVAGKRT
jgi:hypothetical protein